MNSEIPPSAPPTQTRTSGLAIASLVLGLLSCLCLPAPVAIVLGIVALVQMGKDPNLKGKPFAIAGIVLPVLISVLILPAIAIPNFIKFQSRSKQSECKSNLKAIAISQRSRGDEGFTEDMAQLGWTPDGETRYSYVVSSNPEGEGGMVVGSKAGAPAQGQIRDALRQPLAGEAQVGLNGEGVWTGACVGNVDSDDTLDVWSVSSADRDGRAGKIPAWEPHNDVNDITE